MHEVRSRKRETLAAWARRALGDVAWRCVPAPVRTRVVPQPSASAYALAPYHDTALYARVFAAAGRIHVPNALHPEHAGDLWEALSRRTPWSTATNGERGVYDLADADLSAMGSAGRERLTAAVHAQARDRFQFFNKRHILSHAGEPYAGVEPAFRKIVALLNDVAFLDFARRVTGDRAISRADAQATLYEPGHFLTAHDDRHDGKKRRAAFVLTMTRNWRPDYGGLLMFLDDDGHVAEAYCPRFNALNMFRVPQLHSVSLVAPFAPVGRFAITGWLRG